MIKGNVPLRLLGMMIFVMVGLSHLLGQIDLTQMSFLWVLLLMALNAVQASYTGFCPMIKNKDGECVACGVKCDDRSSETPSDAKGSQACCANPERCGDETGQDKK